MGSSWSAEVSTYRKWPKEGKEVSQREGNGKTARVYRRASVEQTPEEVDAGFDRKESEHHGCR